MGLFLLISLSIILPFEGAASELSGGGGSQVPRAVAGAVNTNGCGPEDIEANKKMISECNKNWGRWGIAPRPAKHELRDPNRCPGLVSLGTLEGCANAMMAIPIFVGEMSIRAMVRTAPVDKHSFAYVSQKGSLAQIQEYMTNEFMRKHCKIAQVDEMKYLDIKCPTTYGQNTPHLNPAGFAACKRGVLNDFKEAKECRNSSSTRALYRSERSTLGLKANEIKRVQDERRATEEKYNRDLATVKKSCGFYLNNLRGSMLRFLRPYKFLENEMKNVMMPKEADVKLYNDCVGRLTKGKPELRQALMKNSQGFIEKVFGEFGAIKCYKEKIRREISCDIAMSVMTGGLGLAKAVAHRVGVAAVEQMKKRMVGDSIKYTKETANVVGVGADDIDTEEE